MQLWTPWIEPAFAAAESALVNLPGVVPALLLLPVLVAVLTRQWVHVAAVTLLSLVALVGSAAGDQRVEWRMLGLGAGLAGWVVAILAFHARNQARQLRELLEQAGALQAEAEGLRLHAERAALASLRPAGPMTDLAPAPVAREREFPISRLPTNRPVG